MKPARIVFILLFLSILSGIGVLLYQFRGAAPAVLPATGDIATEIEQQAQPGLNTTDFPLQVADGLAISIFTKELQKPRVLRDDPRGMLLVSDMAAGTILGLPDDNQDGKADERLVLAQNLNEPHGIELYCISETTCTLFVAETGAVYSFAYTPQTRSLTAKQQILELPSGGGHTTRSLQLIDTPDGKQLLIAIGSTCNACNETDDRYAAIMIANLDGTGSRLFATGLRNTVFMTPHPTSGDIWGADMGRDLLGDDLPPDEINILKDGSNYGWPFCYGKNVHDTSFGSTNPCNERQASHIDLPAHSAPLGIGFIPASGWPQDWIGDLIVAYHGSWNRTEPTGYKLVRLELNEQLEFVAEHPFVDGWLASNGQALGRPAGILLRTDGSMFVADDKAGLIYRVSYTP